MTYPLDPGGPTAFPWEAPERLLTLQERLEGRFVARIHFGVGPVPDGWVGVGLELDNGERWAILAGPIPGRGYRTQLFWRLIKRQRIWTKKMVRHFTRGRLEAGEPPPNEIQKQIEDQVIRGVKVQPEATLDGGEQFGMELGDGRVAWFRAGRNDAEGWPNFATLDVQVERPGRMVMPGIPPPADGGWISMS